MTDAEQPGTPELTGAEISTEVRHNAALRLGDLALYLHGLAGEVARPDAELPLGQLSLAMARLHGISNALGGDPAEGIEMYDHFVRAQQETFVPLEYPDTLFYNSILPQGMIPNIDDAPEEQLTLRIIADNKIEHGGKTLTLDGDILYIFNALIAYRGTYVDIKTHLSHGFRRGGDGKTNRDRYHRAVIELQNRLHRVIPEDIDIILRTDKKTRAVTRRLNPVFDIVDARINKAPAEAQIPIQFETRTGVTLTQIVQRTSAGHETVRRRITPQEYAQIFIGPGGFELFPDDVADAIISRFPEAEKPIVEMPEGFTRVSAVVAQLPFNLRVGSAVTKLRRLGFEPVQLNIDRPYAVRGGVWCVKEEGAVEALITAYKRRLPKEESTDTAKEETPATALSDTQEDPELFLPTGLGPHNTAAMIAEYLVAQGIEATPSNIENEAALDTRITPVCDAQGRHAYTLYAAKRIIRAFGGQV